MNTDTKRRQAYICNEDFVANVDGIDKHYREGISRVYEDDPILTKCPSLFDVAEDYEARHGT
jgi:hypothetical protein